MLGLLAWIELAQVRDSGRSLVKALMNFLVPQNSENFFIG